MALLDFAIPGELGVFIDEQQVQALERRMDERGYLEGSEMAGAFNMLRANDLIWSFVINNYLLGREPFPFDLLYWNSDSTRMPAKMHSFYLRNMYLKNALKDPGGITLGGSGHIAGIVNPPAANKYCYWTRDAMPATPEAWQEAATRHEGSWWPDWQAWVDRLNGGERVPARVPGAGGLSAIEDAPGAYVKLRPGKR